MHESNPKKWWDGIKLLSGLSNPPPLASSAVNGTVLNDLNLAVAFNESFCSAADDIPQLTHISVSNILDEYIITRDGVEVALVAAQDRKSVGYRYRWGLFFRAPQGGAIIMYARRSSHYEIIYHANATTRSKRKSFNIYL